MHVVAIINEKGGCGKTTLSTNLAWELRRRGLTTLLADADPQGSATDWFDASEGRAPTTLQVTKKAQLEQLERFVGGASFVLVDGGPGIDTQTTTPALKRADVVLIPVQPSAADIWAARDIVELVRRRQELLSSPKAAFVVSRQIQGTRLAAAVTEALEGLGLPIFDGRTTQRVAYADALGLGTWAGELDEKARVEIERITDELLELCQKTA